MPVKSEYTPPFDGESDNKRFKRINPHVHRTGKPMDREAPPKVGASSHTYEVPQHLKIPIVVDDD